MKFYDLLLFHCASFSFTDEFCLPDNATCVSEVRKLNIVYVNMSNIIFIIHYPSPDFYMCIMFILSHICIKYLIQKHLWCKKMTTK